MTAEQFVFGSLVRWVRFLALAALIGGIALDLVILPRDSLDMAGGRARLRRATRAWILLLALTAAAELWLRTQTMARGGVATTLAAVPAVLTRTSFGTAWIVRLVALALVLLASLLRARAATIITVVAAATVAFTTSLTGHAGDWGTL